MSGSSGTSLRLIDWVQPTMVRSSESDPPDDEHDCEPDRRCVHHGLTAIDRAQHTICDRIRIAGKRGRAESSGHRRANESWLDANGNQSLRAVLVVEALQVPRQP